MIRQFDVRDFDFRNRMVSPKSHGVATNNFHLDRSTNIVSFRKISRCVWILAQRTNKFEYELPLRT